MAKKKEDEGVIVFEGFLTKVPYDTNQDEFLFEFKLDMSSDNPEQQMAQLEKLAEITDDKKNVLSTFKSHLRHNGKIEVPISKTEMRAIYWDPASTKDADKITCEPVVPVKVMLESFIKKKTCKASISYKGKKNLVQHKKLAQFAGHKIKLSFTKIQGELFSKTDTKE